MNSSPLLDMQLRALHLSAIATNYQRLLAEHSEPLPYLTDLIALESNKPRRSRATSRTSFVAPRASGARPPATSLAPERVDVAVDQPERNAGVVQAVRVRSRDRSGAPTASFSRAPFWAQFGPTLTI
jgi:hypothetical protein